MKEIQMTARFTVADGKLAEFESLAVQLMAAVRANEAGKSCSQYDWFYNEDKSEFVVRETYADSAAIFTHIENLGELLPAISAVAKLELEYFGAASEELRVAGAEMGAKFYSHFQSI